MSFDFSKAIDSTTNPSAYFSGRSEDYENYRPVHPAAAIDAVLAGLAPPPQLVAADVGAGTGIGSRLLANRGVKVWAIEPNADMTQAANLHEGIKFIAGTAEAIPLENAAVDVVTSFQAFHWFDFTQSLQEFRRVLKPNGRLALIWSLWDQRDPVSKDYTRLIFEASQPPESPTQPRLSVNSWVRRLRYQLFWSGLWLPYFTHFQRREFQFQQQLDLQGLIGLAHSQGFTPSAGEAFEAMIGALSTFRNRHCNAKSQVQLRYVTRLYLAKSPDRGQPVDVGERL
ncbi:MAG: class I SAM-dependent methyltransferase [Cyanobacteria bacterium P01_D01_bin.71]